MILTPDERTHLLLDALDMWIIEEFETLPMDSLKMALGSREVLLNQLHACEDSCCGSHTLPGGWPFYDEDTQ
jgi:hypothetical protein